MFTGRKEELKELKYKYSTNKLEVILVSGKRRIGKSQLITESQKDFDGVVISYECFKSNYKDNLEKLENELKRQIRDVYADFNSLYNIILFLHQQASNKKILLVIDEYPYMREGDSTDSEIKNALDKINELDASNPLKIIICGSSIDVMNMLDNSDKPLHGRFTSKINLFPLNYLESASFYPNASLEDKVSYYCVLGGVPYFLKQIDDNLSFDENIIHLFFSMNPLLKTELESQINYEITKIENGPFILSILKDKSLPYSDILQVFNNSYPNKSIDYALNKLLDIGVIEKVMIKQDNGKTKQYYRIKDISLIFYYSYLNYSFGNRLLFTDLEYYQTFIEDDLKHKFIPHMFEKVGYTFITLMNKKNLLDDRLINLYPFVINDKITKTSFQFDIVGESTDGLIDYECKYRNEPIKAQDVHNEIQQTHLSKERFYKVIFISKSEVLDKAIKTYYLNDLFSDLLN